MKKFLYEEMGSLFLEPDNLDKYQYFTALNDTCMIITRVKFTLTQYV